MSDWWAIVGVRASELVGGVNLSPHDCCRALDQEYGLEDLRLVPGDTNLVEHRRSEPLSLSGWTTVVSWPIIVVGSGDAGRFTPKFNSQVHRVAALLAIAWNEPWCLRQAAQDLSRLPVAIPESEPHPFSSTVGAQDYASPVVAPLPDLLPRGFVALQRSEVLRRCVNAWHQALLAHTRAPTLAAVGYIRVLESLARTAWGRTFVNGESSNEQFASVVREAGDEYQLQALGPLSTLYSKRSSAVHAATMLGVEEQPGTLFDLGDEHVGADPRRHGFVFRELPALRSVSRMALTMGLMYAD